MNRHGVPMGDRCSWLAFCSCTLRVWHYRSTRAFGGLISKVSSFKPNELHQGLGPLISKFGPPLNDIAAAATGSPGRKAVPSSAETGSCTGSLRMLGQERDSNPLHAKLVIVFRIPAYVVLARNRTSHSTTLDAAITQ